MKKIILAIATIALLSPMSALAVRDTPHDLSSGTTGTGTASDVDRICGFCHTPHGGTQAKAPLWNRLNDITAFSPYTGSPAMDTTMPGTLPNGVSLACMSCHDGTTAMGDTIVSTGAGATFTNAGGDSCTYTAGVLGTCNASLGSDLSNDHPISIAYATAQGGTGDPLDATAGAGTPLFGGNVECASCHAVHTYGATADVQPFLRMSKNDSALCDSCHTY